MEATPIGAHLSIIKLGWLDIAVDGQTSDFLVGVGHGLSIYIKSGPIQLNKELKIQNIYNYFHFYVIWEYFFTQKV